MPVKVSFIKPRLMGSIHAWSPGDCRASETVAIVAGTGTSTLAAEAGEVAWLVSTEIVSVVAAHGATPDAATTTQTPATTAGYGLPLGAVVSVAVKAGDRFNFKTFI